MKILSIGNSFSFDAQRYLHALAKKRGVAMKTVNLFIGGCSLRTHYVNALNDSAAYGFCFNGEETGIKVSISEALSSDDWDVVTLQQASNFSFDYSSYTPYIEALKDYVKKFCPRAKIFIHETWGYESGSDRIKKAGFETQAEMFSKIESAYEQAAELIKADGIIPSGAAMLYASQNGIEKVHRDTFHASLGVGRYMLGLTWFKALTGEDISDDSFSDFDVPVTEEERKIAISAVNAAFTRRYGKLFGKTVLFLGDSLTEGVRGTTSKEKRYANVIAEMTGANAIAYGVGGTKIAYQKKPTLSKPRHDMYFASRIYDMQDKADYVVVFGGINDFGGGDAPLGKMGDTTPETFYGALYDLFTRLKGKYPTARLFAVTPLFPIDVKDFVNKAGCERKEGIKPYADAIKKVSKKFGITVIDAMKWGLNPFDEKQKPKYFSIDAIHPNDDGQRYIAERFVEFFDKNL
ncbi:MAG: SGNH/GDSL hydrolase family protein [Clostridia bacterium]|nr:SGNH/GDSL hydrolase family protein [Clostridia bacterium]